MTRWIPWVLVATLVVTPVVTASWGMRGAYEPSTLRDANDNWMFTSPDTTSTALNPPVRKVYFNGFYGPTNLGQPVNPSTSTVRLEAGPPVFRVFGMMGVWKDCNRDGYVGFADHGLFEYRAELLVDTSICRPGSIPTRIPFNWIPPHNDGEWVHEFLPVSWNRGNAETLGDVNAFNLNDNASRMWADFALPEAATGGGSCGINPQPEGTMHSTGGLIWYADCFTSYKGTDTWNQHAPDDTPLGQLSFRDAPRNQYASQSRLNVKSPWGEEGDASFVSPWDCTQPQLVNRKVDNTTYVNVSRPRSVPGTNAGGSPSGTMNATFSGFDECNRTPRNDGSTHPGRTTARLPYTNEGGVNVPVRRNPDNWLSPPGFEQTRPAAPWSAVLGRGAPADLGLRYASVGDIFTTKPNTNWNADGVWGGQTNWVSTNPWVNRATLVPNRVAFTTFYGIISDEAITRYGLAMPKAAAKGVYGTEPCLGVIGPTAGVRNSWDCNPANWFMNANNQDVEPRSTYQGPGENANQNGVRVGVRVGHLYNLRDIDCNDQSTQVLRSNGVHWGVVTGSTCGAAP